MALTYVHVSDIHFGQEEGSRVFVHDDVKECLIADTAEVRASERLPKMDGVIVTGDVAFSGKADEYAHAGAWLDRLTEAIGCQKTDVMVVPGNHDIDRSRISELGKLMHERMLGGGDDELDRFLAAECDREVLYWKFAEYRNFAEGYGCRLSSDGGVAIERKVQLAPDRFLRFVGLNSALLCSDQDDDGSLLIGGRQRVFQRRTGEELVVLCHHPLESLADEEVASLYIRTRARVHIFGHVHRPSLSVEAPEGNGDLLTLSAGAVVPPRAEAGYSYTYNVISFEWEAGTNGLRVSILPRCWNERETRFGPDVENFASEREQSMLQCPNFEAAENARQVEASEVRKRSDGTAGASRDDDAESQGGKEMGVGNDVLRLHFFRDLMPEQRVEVLIAAGVLPESLTVDLTHVIETRLLDRALEIGRQDALGEAIARCRGETAVGKGP